MRRAGTQEFVWLSVMVLVASALGYWMYAWQGYQQAIAEQGQSVQFASYLSQLLRVSLDDWRSGWLQALGEFAGLILVLPKRSFGHDRPKEL